MEILTPLDEVLSRVETQLRGYDLERMVCSVVQSLSQMPAVTAIFVSNDDRPRAIHFIVVMQTSRTSWKDFLSTSDRMDRRMMPLKRQYHPLQADFSWSLWEKWQRQDNFSDATRVWLRPKKRAAT